MGRPKKMSIKEVAEIIEVEGLEYALLNIKAAEIADTELASEWEQASVALPKIMKKLANYL